MLDPIITLLAQYAAVCLSAIAAFLALRAEYRNQKRFERQMKLSQELAERNVRPLLAITQDSYENDKGLTLYNHGAGTAVVTEVTCLLRGQQRRDVVDVIDISNEVEWDECPELGDEFYIPQHGSEILIHLTEENLKDQKIAPLTPRVLLDELEEQLSEVVIHVSYRDVFGNVIADNEKLHP